MIFRRRDDNCSERVVFSVDRDVISVCNVETVSVRA